MCVCVCVREREIHSRPQESKLSTCLISLPSISSRVVKAISDDYVCLQSTVTKGYHYDFGMERGCIFVPKKVAESKNCGGLRLFESVSSIVSDPDFCGKEFGVYDTSL